jgi:Integrase core domain
MAGRSPCRQAQANVRQRTCVPRRSRSRGRRQLFQGAHLWISNCQFSRTALRRRFGDAGIRVVLTPARAPNANASAERFVRSIKEECLDRIIPIGERHFRHVITEFVEHYHRERNHQGLDNRLIAGTPVTDRTGRVRCRQRLGGLLNFNERAAGSSARLRTGTLRVRIFPDLVAEGQRDPKLRGLLHAGFETGADGRGDAAARHCPR